MRKYQFPDATICEQPGGFALYSKADQKYVRWSLKNLQKLLGSAEGKKFFLDAGGVINPKAR
jgi:hypothetical protein